MVRRGSNALFADKKNKLYLIEGKIYQWRVKGRSFAGAGNGDWSHIDSTEDGSTTNRILSFGGSSSNLGRVPTQGNKDLPSELKIAPII